MEIDISEIRLESDSQEKEHELPRDLPLRLTVPFDTRKERSLSFLRWRFQTWKQYQDEPLSEIQTARELHFEQMGVYAQKADLRLSEDHVKQAARRWWKHNEKTLQLRRMKQAIIETGPDAIPAPPGRDAVQETLRGNRASHDYLRCMYFILVQLGIRYSKKEPLYRHVGAYPNELKDTSTIKGALKRDLGTGWLESLTQTPEDPSGWTNWMDGRDHMRVDPTGGDVG